MRKEYYTEDVKQKNGRICPITKVRYVEDCPVCGQPMHLVSYRKGGLKKRSFKRFECQDKICGHKQLMEGGLDSAIRVGFYDKEIILKQHIER